MYCVLYFNMLLYAVNNSSNSRGDFWIPFAVTFISVNDASTFTSVVSVGLFLLKKLQGQASKKLIYYKHKMQFHENMNVNCLM